MGQQVGEAFVRIRPNMSGFKSETETGVKSSFSSLAKIAGLAFGGAAVGELVKSSVEAAASSQAVTNAVRQEYGKLGDAVLGFAEKQGAAFGALETNTNQASFTLGKLFRNTGFGAEQAALMTKNWERLALALNQARGGGVAGAAQALSLLGTVARGTSTRSLGALGVTITQTQIAAQAAADHFIKLGQSAAKLTPAQKQLVVYQLAIRSLPKALQEAAANSDAFATKQARLAVAWDNAKTALGQALLPELTKGATALTNWLNKMEHSGRLQHDFNVAAHVTATVVGAISNVVRHAVHDIEAFVNLIGGWKNALIALAAALTLVKARSIGAAVQGDERGLRARIEARIAAYKAEVAAARSAADAPKKLSAAWATAHRQGPSAAQKLSAAWATAHRQIVTGAKKAAAETARVTGRIGPTPEGLAKINASIERAQRLLREGKPLPHSDAFEKAALANEGRAALPKGPFSRDWADEQKKNLRVVAGAAQESTKRLGPSPEGLARINAGIERYRRALLAGLPVPKSDAYAKAVAAQENYLRTAFRGIDKTSDTTRSHLGRVGEAFTAAGTKIKQGSEAARTHLGSIGAAATRAATQTRTQFTAASQAARTRVSGIGAAFSSLGAKAKVATQTTVGHINSMGTAFTSFSKTAAAQASGFSSAVRSASSRAGAAFGAAATGMKVAAIEVGATIKTAIIETGIGLLVVAIGIAVGWVISHWDTVKRYTLALAHATAEAFKGMGNIIVGVYKYVYGKVLYYVVDLAKKILDGLASSLGWVPWLGGKLKDAAAAVDGFASSVHHFAETGRQQILTGWSDVTTGVTKAWNDALAKSGGDAKANDTAKKFGHKQGTTMMDGAKTAIVAQAPAVRKAISDALQNAVEAANARIRDSVRAAKDNLDKIGQDLARTIERIQQKIASATKTVAGSPQSAAFEKLKKLIESGAPSFEIERATRALSSQLQNAGQDGAKKHHNQVQQQLADLTAAFDKGEIGYRRFEDRLHKILREHGITLERALKTGGRAFADTFKAEVAALGRQARAIAATPARYRGIGGAGGAADIKIIEPLQVIKQEQRKVRTAVEKAAQQAQKQRAAILKAQQKTNEEIRAAHSIGAKVVTRSGAVEHVHETARLRAVIATTQATTHRHLVRIQQLGNLQAAAQLRGAKTEAAKLQKHIDKLREEIKAGNAKVAAAVRETAQERHRRFPLSQDHPLSAAQRHREEVRAQVESVKRQFAKIQQVGQDIARALARGHDARSLTAEFQRLLRRFERVRVEAPAARSLRINDLTDVLKGALRQGDIKLAGQLAPKVEALKRSQQSDAQRAFHQRETLIHATRAIHRSPVIVKPHTAQTVTAIHGVRDRVGRLDGRLHQTQAVLLRGLRQVCRDVLQADKDIVSSVAGLHTPVERLRRTELLIAGRAERQRDRQARLQAETNVLLRRLNRNKSVPGFHKERPGKGSKDARAAARAGVQA